MTNEQHLKEILQSNDFIGKILKIKEVQDIIKSYDIGLSNDDLDKIAAGISSSEDRRNLFDPDFSVGPLLITDSMGNHVNQDTWTTPPPSVIRRET